MKTLLNAFVIETDGVTSTLTIHSSRFPKFSCLWQESKIPGAFCLFALPKHWNGKEETWVQAPVLELELELAEILDKSLTLPGFQFPHL